MSEVHVVGIIAALVVVSLAVYKLWSPVYNFFLTRRLAWLQKELAPLQKWNKDLTQYVKDHGSAKKGWDANFLAALKKATSSIGSRDARRAAQAIDDLKQMHHVQSIVWCLNGYKKKKARDV